MEYVVPCGISSSPGVDELAEVCSHLVMCQGLVGPVIYVAWETTAPSWFQWKESEKEKWRRLLAPYVTFTRYNIKHRVGKSYNDKKVNAHVEEIFEQVAKRLKDFPLTRYYLHRPDYCEVFNINVRCYLLKVLHRAANDYVRTIKNTRD